MYEIEGNFLCGDLVISVPNQTYSCGVCKGNIQQQNVSNQLCLWPQNKLLYLSWNENKSDDNHVKNLSINFILIFTWPSFILS